MLLKSVMLLETVMLLKTVSLLKTVIVSHTRVHTLRGGGDGEGGGKGSHSIHSPFLPKSDRSGLPQCVSMCLYVCSYVCARAYARLLCHPACPSHLIPSPPPSPSSFHSLPPLRSETVGALTHTRVHGGMGVRRYRCGDGQGSGEEGGRGRGGG
jgi:hypothetical protein